MTGLIKISPSYGSMLPGARKTVLVWSIIEYLKENVKNKDVGLAFFYCDYKESKKQEPSKLLCTLLAQLRGSIKLCFNGYKRLLRSALKKIRRQYQPTMNSGVTLRPS